PPCEYAGNGSPLYRDPMREPIGVRLAHKPAYAIVSEAILACGTMQGGRRMGKLDGKVALISGGARGEGAAEADTCAREGAKVEFGDVRDAEGQQVEAEIRASGGTAVYVHLDVTHEEDWQQAVQMAVERYGKLDILINNAGIVIPRVPIEERTAEEWD